METQLVKGMWKLKPVTSPRRYWMPTGHARLSLDSNGRQRTKEQPSPLGPNGSELNNNIVQSNRYCRENESILSHSNCLLVTVSSRCCGHRDGKDRNMHWWFTHQISPIRQSCWPVMEQGWHEADVPPVKSTVTDVSSVLVFVYSSWDST